MDKSSCYYCQQSRRSRRDFLRLGTLGVLGVNLADFLRFDSIQALAATAPPTKAKAVILLWLEGGISHLDSWDVKGNSRFRPISTNAPGVQIAEVFPSIARHMDKLSIIRSMQTQERNHPQATIETLTGHRPSPALKFPSVGSIVARELGTQNDMPPFAVVPLPRESDFFNYEDGFKASFLGGQYDGLILPDPSKPNFNVPDLSLPKSVSVEAIEDRRTLLKVVDHYYRAKEEEAEFA